MIKRRKHLAMQLDKLPKHPNPSAVLEQYTISGDKAADILWLIDRVYGDLKGKIVADLGCGTGKLTLGSVLLGASYAIGVDLDLVALKTALKSAKALGLREATSWLQAEVSRLSLRRVEIVVQNPPFGVQQRGADRAFLQKAVELAPIVYSLHKSGRGNRAFIRKYVENLKAKPIVVKKLRLELPPTFKFHRKRRHQVEVDLWRIQRVGSA